MLKHLEHDLELTRKELARARREVRNIEYDVEAYQACIMACKDIAYDKDISPSVVTKQEVYDHLDDPLQKVWFKQTFMKGGE